MDKISIITRSYNRLEYTIKCIENVRKYTKYDNYEHIIINNNSSDGTKEWLNWIKLNNIEYYNKLKIFNMDKNYGDWGGMLKSLEYISEDSKYIVQLDNDIIINDELWLNKMIHVLNNNISIVQLKRIGVKNIIKPKNIIELKFNNESLKYGNIYRPVACFMLKTDDILKNLNKLRNSPLLDINGKISGKTLLSKYLGNKTVKLINVYCYIIDGIHDTKLNGIKYPFKIVHNLK